MLYTKTIAMNTARYLFSALLLLGLACSSINRPKDKDLPASDLPLESIRLPEGFQIDIYAADVTNARSMDLSPGGVLYVGTRSQGDVYALVDRDGDFVADLITKFWRRKKDWLIEGHWLSVNLPASLPAPLGLASIGRDKVGVSCEVVRSEGPKTELIVPRGRQNTTKDGDENDALARGIATVSRLKWAGETALPPEFLNSL